MRRFVPFKHRRASLCGWWCWLLALAPLFSTVAFDTWLNTENLRNDYEAARLSRRLKELKDSLDDLKVKTATLEALDRIETKAPDLDLIEPEPDQIQIIYTSEPIAEAASWRPAADMAHEKFGFWILDFGLSTPKPLVSLVPDFGIANPKSKIQNQKSEETSWDTDPVSSLASTTPRARKASARVMEDLLQRAISSAYAYCAGDS
jgi:hypothetical protein